MKEEYASALPDIVGYYSDIASPGALLLALISTAGQVETAEEEELVCAALPYAGAGDIDEVLKNVLQYSDGASKLEQIVR